MDQFDRDRIELGARVETALHFENDNHPKLRAMRVRHQATYAQMTAETRQILDEVWQT